jgi:spore coat polysaccharide biosynthesis predicted glycosyltransferase SpsG/CTP:molybdopterin cytidylyltransferase MocA
MKDGEQILAVIPARGAYDAVPYLNIRPLGGKPLLAHTIEAALGSRSVDRTIVSTEDERIAEVARRWGAEAPFLRPAELSRNIPSLNPVLLHAAEELERLDGFRAATVVSLLPTTPFRRADVVDQVIDRLVETGADSVITVTEERWMNWKVAGDRIVPLFEQRGRREKMEPIYREVGAALAIRRSVLSTDSRLGDNVGHVTMDKYSAFTVHTLAELWAAERLVGLARVVVRVDGGRRIGMGHVFTSLAVAESLRRMANPEICFLMSAEHPEGIAEVSRAGFPVRILHGGGMEEALAFFREFAPTVIVNDLPFLSSEYLAALERLGATAVNLVDSRADLERPESTAGVIISMARETDQTPEEFYAGPAFAVLRDSFRETDKAIRERGERVLVTFGGSDPQGLTLKAVAALESLPPEVSVTVVLGPAFAYEDRLGALVAGARRPFTILERVDAMAELIVDADLVLCSGGMTVYELAALGTPGIVCAQNVREAARMRDFARQGSVLYLGLGSEVSAAELGEIVRALLAEPGRRRAMSQCGKALVDGYGADRVADVIVNAPPK